MQAQTTYICTPEDLEATMNRVIAPLNQRMRELEIAVGSAKHMYTVAEVAERTSYSVDIIRRWIREGAKTRKGKTIYLEHKEITNGDYRITPTALDRFLAQF